MKDFFSEFAITAWQLFIAITVVAALAFGIHFVWQQIAQPPPPAETLAKLQAAGSDSAETRLRQLSHDETKLKFRNVKTVGDYICGEFDDRNIDGKDNGFKPFAYNWIGDRLMLEAWAIDPTPCVYLLPPIK